MKLSKKLTSIVAIGVLAAFGLTACGGGNQQAAENQEQKVPTTNLVFASGGTSGTYYPYAGAVANAWKEAVPGLSVDVQSTGASAENINLVNNGEAEIAIVQNDVMTYAYNATETFAGKEPITGFSTMATVYAEVCQIVLAPNSGIESIADLAGKRVSVGAPGSGVESNARQILGAAGLTFDDIDAQYLGFGDSANAIKDKALDAAFVTAGTPTTAVMELASTNDISLLALDQAMVDKLVAEYPYYTLNVIPAGTYESIQYDVLTVAVKATIIVSPELDEELVYNMTKALFDSKDAITTAHVKGAELDVKAAVEGASVPLHPGAEKFYKEQGVIE